MLWLQLGRRRAGEVVGNAVRATYLCCAVTVAARANFALEKSVRKGFFKLSCSTLQRTAVFAVALPLRSPKALYIKRLIRSILAPHAQRPLYPPTARRLGMRSPEQNTSCKMPVRTPTDIGRLR